MAYTKLTLLDKAIEITKAYASSSNASVNIQEVLAEVYKKLVELNSETD